MKICRRFIPDSVVKYWMIYGGVRSFFSSAYFYWSLLLTAGLYASLELKDGVYWADIVLQVSPSLLGFVLAGTAVFVGMRDPEFAKLICGNNEEKPSTFMVTTAAFVHFMFVNVLSILNAIFVKTYAPFISRLHHIATIWLFCYSVLLSAAAIFAVFKLSEWYNAMHTANNRDVGDTAVITSITEAVSVERRGAGDYRVYLPFSFADGDELKIILKSGSDGRFTLTDEAHTMMYLSYHNLDTHEGQRRKILDKILGIHGVQYDDGRLIMSNIAPADVGHAVYTFAQAVIEICNVCRIE